ncbi:helix-turn-helix domain-containing protein [Rothia halotolerans]|uniref:helix-turn-helix domain-containing protein n=1 Tax=Rothia halotolerans TaxID=405770 RepID=UPI00101C62D6|nr:helix-turn-helix domain-containing protein [Rothia halotolerans]
MSTTSAGSGLALPRWAVQRVSAVVRQAGGASGGSSALPLGEIARKAGISKSLTRRCLRSIGA